MLYKARTKSLTHLIMESLYHRMDLPYQYKQYYWNQEFGFEGEVNFDPYFAHLNPDALILNGLSLKDNIREFQIDSLVIFGDTANLYEAKNYRGNYVYKNNALLTPSQKEIAEPAGQVIRARASISNIVRALGYDFQVNEYVVFINPEFHLYNSPLDKPFLFVSQLPGHVKSLNTHSFATGKKQLRLAEEVAGQHSEHIRRHLLPDYMYEDLRKGIMCPHCFSFAHRDTRQLRFCKKCGHKETTDEAIRLSIEELRRLFPKMKLTTPLIHDWCGGVYSKQRVGRVLRRHYTMHGKRHTTFYD